MFYLRLVSISSIGVIQICWVSATLAIAVDHLHFSLSIFHALKTGTMASGALFSLNCHSNMLMSVGDHVIHTMARMQPRTLREGWKQMMQEDSPKIYDELEKGNA